MKIVLQLLHKLLQTTIYRMNQLCSYQKPKKAAVMIFSWWFLSKTQIFIEMLENPFMIHQFDL
jgi:hypothetical protein